MLEFFDAQNHIDDMQMIKMAYDSTQFVDYVIVQWWCYVELMATDINLHGLTS